LFNQILLLSAMLIVSACANTNGIVVPTTATTAPQPSQSTGSEPASFTRGAAVTTNPGLFSCKGGRVTALGEIKSEDGKTWTVPTKVNSKLPDASDLFNPCTNIVPPSLAAVDLNKLPVIEVDSDGVVITGYIFADNYFELYVNGKPVVKDAVPFTPFNSHIVRFKAKYPITYALKAVDWEENLGLGTEDNKGNKYHPGDAGIVATFSDGTVTDNRWKAQSFYIAPLTDKTDLIIEEKDGRTVRSTPNASKTPACAANCFAAHFPVPENWYAVDFNDSSWPQAITYTAGAVGVDNKKEYTNFSNEFKKGSFVWTNNLILDNEILLRYTVEKASK
jgi:hypothetical protein